MSSDENQAPYQANAEEKQPTHMQLNEAPSPPGPAGDLLHETREKRKAANYIRVTLGPAVQKAGAKADTSSEAVVGVNNKTACVLGALRGWETQKGLQDCLTTWDRQLKNLTGRLSAEAAALETTNWLFSGHEATTKSGFEAAQNGFPPSGSPYSPISGFMGGAK